MPDKNDSKKNEKTLGNLLARLRVVRLFKSKIWKNSNRVQENLGLLVNKEAIAQVEESDLIGTADTFENGAVEEPVVNNSNQTIKNELNNTKAVKKAFDDEEKTLSQRLTTYDSEAIEKMKKTDYYKNRLLHWAAFYDSKLEEMSLYRTETSANSLMNKTEDLKLKELNMTELYNKVLSVLFDEFQKSIDLSCAYYRDHGYDHKSKLAGEIDARKYDFANEFSTSLYEVFPKSVKQDVRRQNEHLKNIEDHMSNMTPESAADMFIDGMTSIFIPSLAKTLSDQIASDGANFEITKSNIRKVLNDLISNSDAKYNLPVAFESEKYLANEKGLYKGNHNLKIESADLISQSAEKILNNQFTSEDYSKLEDMEKQLNSTKLLFQNDTVNKVKYEALCNSLTKIKSIKTNALDDTLRKSLKEMSNHALEIKKTELALERKDDSYVKKFGKLNENGEIQNMQAKTIFSYIIEGQINKLTSMSMNGGIENYTYTKEKAKDDAEMMGMLIGQPKHKKVELDNKSVSYNPDALTYVEMYFNVIENYNKNASKLSDSGKREFKEFFARLSKIVCPEALVHKKGSRVLRPNIDEINQRIKETNALDIKKDAEAYMEMSEKYGLAPLDWSALKARKMGAVETKTSIKNDAPQPKIISFDAVNSKNINSIDNTNYNYFSNKKYVNISEMYMDDMAKEEELRASLIPDAEVYFDMTFNIMDYYYKNEAMLTEKDKAEFDKFYVDLLKIVCPEALKKHSPETVFRPKLEDAENRANSLTKETAKANLEKYLMMAKKYGLRPLNLKSLQERMMKTEKTKTLDNSNETKEDKKSEAKENGKGMGD